MEEAGLQLGLNQLRSVRLWTEGRDSRWEDGHGESILLGSKGRVVCFIYLESQMKND